VISVEFVYDDLPEGQALDIKEERGRIVFRIDRHLPKEQIPEVLNAGSKGVVAGGHWFQEWHGEIVTSEDEGNEVGRRKRKRRHLRNVNRPDSAAS
jgi:hypothetical protein